MIEWSDDAVVGVVMASKGYPGDYKTGGCTGYAGVGCRYFCFSCGNDAWREAGYILSNGGRLLLTTAKGPTIKDAVEKVNEEMKTLDNEEFFYRKDIAHKAL